MLVQILFFTLLSFEIFSTEAEVSNSSSTLSVRRNNPYGDDVLNGNRPTPYSEMLNDPCVVDVLNGERPIFCSETLMASMPYGYDYGYDNDDWSGFVDNDYIAVWLCWAHSIYCAAQNLQNHAWVQAVNYEYPCAQVSVGYSMERKSLDPRRALFATPEPSRRPTVESYAASKSFASSKVEQHHFRAVDYEHADIQVPLCSFKPVGYSTERVFFERPKLLRRVKLSIASEPSGRPMVEQCHSYVPPQTNSR